MYDHFTCVCAESGEAKTTVGGGHVQTSKPTTTARAQDTTSRKALTKSPNGRPILASFIKRVEFHSLWRSTVHEVICVL